MFTLFDILSGKVVINNGDIFYFKDIGPNMTNTGDIIGGLHRIGGPALKTSNIEFWCIDGKLHREDGPAVIYANGEKLWFIDDVEYTEENFNKELYARRNKPI